MNESRIFVASSDGERLRYSLGERRYIPRMAPEPNRILLSYVSVNSTESRLPLSI